ncbi:MAG: PEGA domain-containing protein, partial [Deltaproteobacteria bacterium]|nr:PEGA domain-containing protein [Deltaproteobacteria bacterium]
MKNRCSSIWLVARGLVVTALALLLSLPLQAQPDPSSGAGDRESTEAPADDAEKLERAKKYFHQGNEMRKVRDYERALSFYAKSRELVPSGPNTMNAAFCLDKLGRSDEALEMYEALLTRFPDTITDADREIVIPTVEKLRKQVGSIEVDANVQGQLLVEGRPRGTVPRTTPVRVMPGKRKVRVIKDGYRPYERTVKVTAGETVKVDAELEPLPTGRVAITDQAVTCHGADPVYCAGADVWIDGAIIGSVPWEGELRIGAHWLVLRRADMGSAP